MSTHQAMSWTLTLPGCPDGPVSPFLPGEPVNPGGPIGPGSPESPGEPKGRNEIRHDEKKDQGCFSQKHLKPK